MRVHSHLDVIGAAAGVANVAAVVLARQLAVVDDVDHLAELDTAEELLVGVDLRDGGGRGGGVGGGGAVGVVADGDGLDEAGGHVLGPVSGAASVNFRAKIYI